MKLSREAIQRMVGDRVGGGGGAGGGGGISMDDIQGMGFATQQWVGENYLSIAFFSSLFKAYTSQMVEVVPNGGDVSTIENIKAMFGFWTEQYVSSLGYNSSGGGGGGADLNLLLDNINDSNIGNIAPTASEVGKCLVYNGNNTWAWATPGGGGGGGTGTVTSITAGTGLSGGTITTSGTIAISSTYQTYISDGETAYGWGNHANAGYLTQSSLNGYATQQWVGENYLSIAFFSSLFKAYTSQMVEVVPNSGDVTTIENIKAMFGFWTEQYVSSLGYNSSGGGGGGADLKLLLDNINDSNIGNIAPTASEVGKCLVYNGNNTWAWATPGGGGGTGTVTLTGDVTGTGTGTVATTIGAGRVTNSMLAGDIANDKLLHDTITIADVDVALGESVSAYNLWNGMQNELNGRYVTLNTAQNITATKTFTVYQNMRGINLDTQGDIRQKLPNNGGTFYLGYNAGGGSTGFNLAYSPDAVNVSQLVSVLPNGNLGIGNNSPSYRLDVSGNIHTSTAYYLDNKLFANNNNGLHIGYGFAAADLPTTLWGDEISFRSIDGTFGECTTIGNTYGIMGTDFIGVTNKFRFEYDSTNNTVWVLKSDGTAVNFASLGGVSALGISTGGTPSLSVLTLQTLTVNGSATINTLAVTNEIETLDVNTMHVTNELWLNGNSIYMDGGNIEDAYQLQTTQMIVGSGGSTIKKIYWDGTYLQVQIGSTTYKFRPDATA